MISLTTLENGIQVVTEQMLESRAVAIGILVGAGPRDEPESKSGLAHLLEHALFHGTSSRSSMDISRLIDMVGGRVSAFTGRDYTCFSAIAMDDHRTYLFDLFSDMLLNSIFPEKKLANEKNVILSEYQMELDQPIARVQSLIKSSIWPQHALGKHIEGVPEDIAALSREDLIYFLHTHYLPNRITIGVAGNLEHEDIVAQVRDCFWRLSGTGTKSAQPPPIFTGQFVREDIESRQSYFSVALEAPEYAHQDRYLMHLLNTVLGGGLSSRLFRVLREEHGLVYDIHSEYHAYKDAGTFIISGSTQPDQVFNAVDEIVDITEQLVTAEKPVTEEELWHAKLYTTGQHHIDSEDPYTRMSRMITQLFYLGRTVSQQDIIDGIEKVSTDVFTMRCRELYPNISNKISAAVLGPSV